MATDFAAAAVRDVSIGRVLSRSFGVMGDNPVAVFGIAFLLGALPQFLFQFARDAMAVQLATSSGGQLSLGALSLVGGLISILLSTLVQAALVRATVGYASAERPGIGACLASALGVALPLLGLSILFGAAVTLGMILFLVPGILLYLRWVVAAPALVAERNGVFSAFGRSSALTKGARWKVFGLSLIVLIVILLVSAVIGVLGISTVGIDGLVSGARPPVTLLLVNLVVSTLIAAFWSTVTTSLYVELRQWKEGPEDARLADIFA